MATHFKFVSYDGDPRPFEYPFVVYFADSTLGDIDAMRGWLSANIGRGDLKFLPQYESAHFRIEADAVLFKLVFDRGH